MLRNQAFYKLEDIYKDFWNFEITDRVCFFRRFTLNLEYFDIFVKFLNTSYQQKKTPHTNFTKSCFLQTRRHIQRFLKFWENWHGSFFCRFTPNLAYFDIFVKFLERSYQRQKIPLTNFTKSCFLQTRRHI